MNQKLKLLAIVGFIQLFTYVVYHQNVNAGLINILGYKVFKIGNKTARISEIEGLTISSDQFYKDIFEQPHANLFVIKDGNTDSPQMILSGTAIEYDAYENFSAIRDDYLTDSTLIIISNILSQNNFEVFFSTKMDSTITIRAKFYSTYPYYYQLFSYWYGNKNEMPIEVETAFNSFSLK